MKLNSRTAVRHTKGPDVMASEEVQGELPGPTHGEIQQRAYEIHLERGGLDGHDLEDWLQAEEEVKARYLAS
jgi:Protein of unknown function (DUF2934)